MKLQVFDWTDEYKDVNTLLDSLDISDDWSNGLGAIYAEHEHPYDKTLYCLDGSVVFTVAGTKYELNAGQGLRLPRQTAHSAVVGYEGTRCTEVHEN